MPPLTKIEEMEKKIDQVLFYLHNDNHTGKKGLVQEMADLKNEIFNVKVDITAFINEYKKQEAVKQAKVGVIAALVGGSASLVVWLVKIFIVK